MWFFLSSPLHLRPFSSPPNRTLPTSPPPSLSTQIAIITFFSPSCFRRHLRHHLFSSTFFPPLSSQHFVITTISRSFAWCRCLVLLWAVAAAFLPPSASSSFSWCDHHQQLHLFLPAIDRPTPLRQASITGSSSPFQLLSSRLVVASTTIDSTWRRRFKPSRTTSSPFHHLILQCCLDLSEISEISHRLVLLFR